MACPNCGHTLEAIIAPGPPGTIGAAICYWCPRCGTVLCGGQTCTPKLVERCRAYEDGWFAFESEAWKSLGIAESIRPESERLLPSVAPSAEMGMDLKIDPAWLLRMAEAEDGCYISVGGLAVSVHKQLCEDAKNAAYRLHADTSVPASVTRASLKDLRDHIDMLIDCLDVGGTGQARCVPLSDDDFLPQGDGQ
jgi:hypothetical protein